MNVNQKGGMLINGFNLERKKIQKTVFLNTITFTNDNKCFYICKSLLFR